jgi:hypothetical protein
MQFNWKHLVSKEYGTTFTDGTKILLLLAWESYVNLGSTRSEDRFEVLDYDFCCSSQDIRWHDI